MVLEKLSLQEAQARVAAELETVAENPGGPVMAGRPEEAFSGCETVIANAPHMANSRQRIEDAAMGVDRLTSREFASFSVDELARSLGADEIHACWFRLDGIWREDRNVSLDTSFIPQGWNSTRPELVHLANGTYTTPLHIAVLSSPSPESFLRIKTASDADAPILYSSTDGVRLKELLEQRGKTKVYMAQRPAPGPGLAQRMTIDVTQTGYLRLRIGATSFYRPAPGEVSKVRSDDAFMLGYTMENLPASRRGYDITRQNPNRLFQNPMSEVFDFDIGRGAVIDDKRVVPMGLKLVKEETQGTVHYSSSISSEREYQSMTRSMMGNSTRIGASGSVGAGGKDGGPSASISGEVGASWGSESAKLQFASLTSSNSVAEEIGYMRFKKLALVLDPAYARLTDRFVDAIADARRSGDFRELFSKFGTHYPYAVTYGAAGEVRQRITASAFQRLMQNQSSDSSNATGSFFVGESTTYRSNETQSGTSLKETNEYGERTFDAVGGNGSWDQNGFSSPDGQYPILADLRPLSELLNPINFPGQPEIHIDLRRNMEIAIQDYMISKADLSEASLRPAVVEVPKEKPWEGTIRVMKIVSWNGGKGTITVTSPSPGARPGYTRICMVNHTKGTRTLVHQVKNINNLETDGSGTRSCANFPSSITLNLTAMAAGKPAAISNATDFKLAAFEGRLLEFTWR